MVRLPKVFLIGLCLLLPFGAAPAVTSSAPAAPQTGTVRSAAGITAVKTDISGLTLWLSNDPSRPLVAMTAILPAGSAYDPIDKSGLAALSARLLASGALLPATSGAKLISPEVRFTATATRDHLEISLLAPADKAAALCKILGEALAHPQLPARALNDARLDQMQDLEDRDQTPAERAEDQLYSLYFGTGGYGHPVMGSKSALSQIRQQDVLRFIRGHWARGRVAVAVSGNADPDTAREMVSDAFGALPAANVPAIPRPRFSGAPGLHHIAMPLAQPVAVIALPGLRSHDHNQLAAQIAAFILGGHDGAPLTRSLRDSHQLTDTVRARLQSLSATGLTTITLQSAPRDMREALSRLRQDLRRYALQGPSKTDFSDAKLYFRDSRLLTFASDAASARLMARSIADGHSLADMRNYAGQIEHLSLSEVRRMANWLYRSEDLTIVVLGPLPKAERSSNPYRK